MGTAMVTTDIGVDGAIITVGAEDVVIITDGTEAAVTVTGRLLLEGSGVITLLRLLRQASAFPTRPPRPFGASLLRTKPSAGL